MNKITVEIKPKRDTDNSYPPEVKFTMKSNSLIIHLDNRSLVFSKDDIIEMVECFNLNK